MCNPPARSKHHSLAQRVWTLCKRTWDESGSSDRTFSSTARLLFPDDPINGRFRGIFNIIQMIFAPETLGVNLINVFRARWPRGEPSAPCDDFDTTNRLVIAWRTRQPPLNRLAGKLIDIETIGIEKGEAFSLLS